RRWPSSAYWLLAIAPAASAALDGPPADVVAMELAMPGDACHRLVRTALRLGDVLAQGTHAQHAATGRDHLVVDQPGAGVEDLAVVRLGYVPAADDVASARRAGVVLGGHHDAQAGARVPVGLDALLLAIDRGFHRVQEVRARPHHHGLGLRVAEADVELDHLRRAIPADHQPGVQEAGERHAVGRHAAHGGLDHLAHDPRVHLRRNHRGGGVGAHAAGVGPGVAVADPLVVLAGRHGQGGGAVDDRDEAGLLAVQELLDYHPCACVSERVAGQH